MDKLKKMVVIYLPNGSEAKYTTVDLDSKDYKLVKTIECELDRVNISYIEDGKIEGEAYVGMPYYLNMFQ